MSVTYNIENKFTFSNQMLHEAIAWSNSEVPRKHFRGGYSQAKGGAAYIFLVMCAREAFNIRRHPSYEDRYLTEFSRENLDFLNRVSDKEIIEGAKELQKLWEFGQKHIMDSRITLKRNIYNPDNKSEQQYASNILAEKMHAVKNKLDHISIEMDTINGFTKCGNAAYGGVELEFSFDKEDILFFGDTIAYAETDEWVVLNRDPRGLVSIPVENINCASEKDFKLLKKDDSRKDRLPYVQPTSQSKGIFVPSKFTKLGLLLDRKLNYNKS